MLSQEIDRFARAQQTIVEIQYATHRSNSYAAGYFQSMAAQMFQQMTKKQRQKFLSQLEQDAATLEAVAKKLQIIQ